MRWRQNRTSTLRPIHVLVTSGSYKFQCRSKTHSIVADCPDCTAVWLWCRSSKTYVWIQWVISIVNETHVLDIHINQPTWSLLRSRPAGVLCRGQFEVTQVVLLLSHLWTVIYSRPDVWAAFLNTCPDRTYTKSPENPNHHSTTRTRSFLIQTAWLVNTSVPSFIPGFNTCLKQKDSRQTQRKCVCIWTENG